VGGRRVGKERGGEGNEMGGEKKGKLMGDWEKAGDGNAVCLDSNAHGALKQGVSATCEAAI